MWSGAAFTAMRPVARVFPGNGYEGMPEEAPFGIIIATCAPVETPEKLLGQLGDGGRMALPVGGGGQRLVLYEKRGGQTTRRDDIMVRFVPMVRGAPRGKIETK